MILPLAAVIAAEQAIYAEGSYWIDPDLSPARRERIEKAIIRSAERERQRVAKTIEGINEKARIDEDHYRLEQQLLDTQSQNLIKRIACLYTA